MIPQWGNFDDDAGGKPRASGDDPPVALTTNYFLR